MTEDCFSTKEQREFSEESLPYTTVVLGQLEIHTQTTDFSSYLTPDVGSNPRWTIDLEVGAETVRLLEESTFGTLGSAKIPHIWQQKHDPCENEKRTNWSLLFKRHYSGDEKTRYRLGENICKPYD